MGPPALGARSAGGRTAGASTKDALASPADALRSPMPLPPSVRRIVRALFERPPVLAVLGAHPEPYRPAHYVPAYLQDHGATILPVNPRYAGTPIHGTPCLPDLATAARRAEPLGGLDAIVVFRRSEALPGHLEALRAARPTVVWLQQGIGHAEVADALRTDGIEVVEDRCLKVDHARGLGF